MGTAGERGDDKCRGGQRWVEGHWCQDMDFSEKYELGLEGKSFRTFPRIR